MKIVFGQIPEEYLEHSEDHFIGHDGQPYYFQMEVEFEEDDRGTIRINDGCDRYMPIDFESLDSLVAALQTLQEYRNDKRQFANYWKARWLEG